MIESSSIEVDLYQPRQQGFLSAPDGTSIYYEVAGEGRPLLFCYGLVCRREHWRHQLEHFCKQYKVVAFDYRGHQRSAVPANERNLTLDWCARDAVAVAEHLGLEDVVIFGHSMGVPVASLASVKLAERVKGLILVCGTVTNPLDGMFNSNRVMHLYDGMNFLYTLSPSLMGGVWKRLTDLNRINYFITSRFGFNPYLADRQDVFSYMEGVNQTPLKVFYPLITDYVRYDGREDLSRVTCPTLVVAGNEDQITPLPLQEEMVRILKKGELVKIPMGSHNAHSDVPDMVNQKIEGFLKSIGYL